MTQRDQPTRGDLAHARHRDLAPLWAALAHRYGRGDTPRTVTLPTLTAGQSEAIGRLLRRTRPVTGNTSVPLERIAAAYRLTDVGLRRLVEHLHGPIRDRAQQRAGAAAARQQLLDRAAAVADAVHRYDPSLADALTEPGRRSTTLEALTFAAEDLVAGRRYDGPRAWSQHHYPHVAGDPSKHRDNIADLLTDAGADPDTIAELGLGRPADFGVGGTLRACKPDGELLVSEALHGLAIIDADQPMRLQVSAGPLVVIENRQAARAVTVDWPVAVVYTAGVPSGHACDHIAGAARQADRVIVVPDADLGGVRIAERIVQAVRAAAAPVDVVDVGAVPHRRTSPYTATYRALLERHTDGPAGDLAAAILARGYRLEQEALIRQALTRTLAAARRR